MPNPLPAIPHDSDAEQIILANCLFTESVAPLADLREEEFGSGNNQAVARGLRHLSTLGTPINLVEVGKYLIERENGMARGLASYLSQLMDGVPELSNGSLEHYRERIRATAEKSAALKSAAALAVDVSQAGSSVTVEEIHERAQRIVDQTAPKLGRPPKDKKLYPEVPAEAWRSHTELYRAAVGPSTEASDNYHLFAFLTGIGALLGRSVYTNMGRRVYPNIYLILVGEAGRARKGTACDYMLQFVADVDPDTYVTYSVASAPGFIQDLADAQSRLRDQKKLWDELRCVVSIDEFRSLIEKSLQKATGDITPLLCKAYDCPPKLDLPTRQNAKAVERPTSSILAGTSPSYLQNLSLADIEGGLGSRLTFVPGDPKARKADPPDPDTTILNPVKMAIRDIVDEYRARGVTRIGLTQAAHERWVKYYEHEYNPPGHDPLVMALSERDHMTCRKLALIYTALDRADVTEIHHLEAAIRATEFLYESRYPIFAGHGLSPAAQTDNQIIKKVTENGPGGISYRGLQKALPRVDTETFHRRMKALSAPDSPLRIGYLGKKRYVYLND